MAKIDTTAIEGYADMTAEEKLAALEAYDIPKPDMSGYVPKDQFDKKMSEASTWKEKYRSTLSDSEKKDQESSAAFEEMKKELEALRHEKVVGQHRGKYLAMGYDEKLASEAAEALVSGDLEKVFAAQQAFMDAHDKSMKATLMKSAPTPPAGVVTGTADYDTEIKSALSRGDYATAAAYTRMRQTK